jgi:uncharacterized protein YndB with AHSA1/START domain
MQMPRSRQAAAVTHAVSCVSSSVHIDVPAETVWGAISDVRRMGEWSPETTSCAWRGKEGLECRSGRRASGGCG